MNIYNNKNISSHADSLHHSVETMTNALIHSRYFHTTKRKVHFLSSNQTQLVKNRVTSCVPTMPVIVSEDNKVVSIPVRTTLTNTRKGISKNLESVNHRNALNTYIRKQQQIALDKSRKQENKIIYKQTQSERHKRQFQHTLYKQQIENEYVQRHQYAENYRQSINHIVESDQVEECSTTLFQMFTEH